jgi:four helix bundle protein
MKHAWTNEMPFVERNTSRPRMESGTLRCDAGITSQAKEGSSREGKKDYLHFLYIARGSLSEAQYFVHLSRRLGYLSEEDATELDAQTKATFGCLHGLIQAVEKETGKMGKAIASITSLLVIGFARFSTGQ